MNQLQLLPVRKVDTKPRRLIVGSVRTEIFREYAPYIRLRGRWLQDAGFSIDRHVKVEATSGRLTIEQIE